jgi:hypothetical protein
MEEEPKKSASPKETPKEKGNNLLCACPSFSPGCIEVLFITKLVVNKFLCEEVEGKMLELGSKPSIFCMLSFFSLLLS